MSNKLDPTAVLDIRELTNHPLYLPYSEIYHAVIVNGKVEHGRSQPGYALTGFSPFVMAAKAAVKHGLEKHDVVDVIEAVFALYYANVEVSSAKEWLGLAADKTSPLASTPPWGAVFPWRARSIESYQNAFEKAAIEENKSVGRDKDITDGWLFCGPVSDDKRRIEADRMFYVLSRINNQGFQRHDGLDGDARATALVNEQGDWRWILTGGNHRASAATALGYKEIPIRVNLVINRGQVDFWPHVVDGLFTRQEALDFFDMIYNGETPDYTRDWEAAIKNEAWILE